MTEKPKLLAIDFDGTIHNDKDVLPGYRMGQPFLGTQDALRRLKAMGYDIVVHCFWADSAKNVQVIRDWLHYFAIPFDEVTNIKPNAVAYIDDKAIKFENNWDQIIEEL